MLYIYTLEFERGGKSRVVRLRAETDAEVMIVFANAWKLGDPPTPIIVSKVPVPQLPRPLSEG